MPTCVCVALAAASVLMIILAKHMHNDASSTLFATNYPIHVSITRPHALHCSPGAGRTMMSDHITSHLGWATTRLHSYERFLSPLFRRKHRWCMAEASRCGTMQWGL